MCVQVQDCVSYQGDPLCPHSAQDVVEDVVVVLLHVQVELVVPLPDRHGVSAGGLMMVKSVFLASDENAQSFAIGAKAVRHFSKRPFKCALLYKTMRNWHMRILATMLR